MVINFLTANKFFTPYNLIGTWVHLPFYFFGTTDRLGSAFFLSKITLHIIYINEVRFMLEKICYLFDIPYTAESVFVIGIAIFMSVIVIMFCISLSDTSNNKRK